MVVTAAAQHEVNRNHSRLATAIRGDVAILDRGGVLGLQRLDDLAGAAGNVPDDPHALAVRAQRPISECAGEFIANLLHVRRDDDQRAIRSGIGGFLCPWPGQKWHTQDDDKGNGDEGLEGAHSRGYGGHCWAGRARPRVRSRMQRTPSAIVTGAGSGIGRAIAQQLAAAGYRLTIAGRRRAALEETLQTCHGSAEIRPVSCDVSAADQVESLVDEHVKHFGGLDVLVNNAGMGEVHPLGTIGRDDITSAMMTNACSAGWAIARAWPTWVRQQHGCIINIASMAVFDPFPGFFGYAASKAALAMMAVSAAKEGAANGIKAFAICPGAVETEMLRASFSSQVIPPDQCLSPDEVAAVVMECVRGKRDQESGRAIAVVSTAAQTWLQRHRESPGLWLR